MSLTILSENQTGDLCLDKFVWFEYQYYSLILKKNNKEKIFSYLLKETEKR